MALIPGIKTKHKAPSSFDPLRIDCPPTDNISTAQFALIGESPSSAEVIEGEPFVGPAGSQLNRICAAVRIPRHTIYLTNCCKAEIPKNNTNKLWTEKGFRCEQWAELQKLLIEELQNFNGKVIITLGATATLMLLDQSKFSKIGKFRGSVYKTSDFAHLKDKLPNKLIMPSYHPSFTLIYKSPISFYVMIMDFQKAIDVDDNPELLDAPIVTTIKPTMNQIREFYNFIHTKDLVAFDIEATPRFITCFSLAIKTDDGTLLSMSIPLMDSHGNYWTINQEVEIWEGLAKILGSKDLKIICQNGMFDIMFVLRTMNIISDNFYFDTMLAQHLVYTELPKGLDFLTSVYTYFPYYKDEGKLAHLQVIKDWPAYWEYNAKDSAYLIPIMEKLKVELDEFDCTEAMQYQMELHKPLMEMEFNGILTDQEGITAYKKVLSRKIRALQLGLNKIAGRDLNINSSKQLIAYFYGMLMIKPYINPKSKNATCNTVALHRIAKKGKKGSIEAKMIIKVRKYFKLLSTYFTINVDDDHKLRCSHKIAGTVSGRIATGATFFETSKGEKIGTNLQNQPYVYKKYLMADVIKEEDNDS